MIDYDLESRPVLCTEPASKHVINKVKILYNVPVLTSNAPIMINEVDSCLITWNCRWPYLVSHSVGCI